MKLIEFKEYNNTGGEKVLNKKKTIVFILILLLVCLSITFSIIYVGNANFRNWADKCILMKSVSEGTLASIDIDINENNSVYAYDKYITILKDNNLNIYNSSAKKVATLNVNISNPIFSSNGKYLIIAEKTKQKVYLISNNKILTTVDAEGSISRISVNENGYMSIIANGTTYKSVIFIFDQNGKQILKTYIPNNSVIDSTISSDNKYLSFAEIDTNGTVIKTVIKTLSIKETQNSAEETKISTYEFPTDVLSINIRYQGSKNLICMCNNGIHLLSDGNDQILIDFKQSNKNYTYAGIDLINNIYSIEEKSEGISNQISEITLLNTGTKKINKYEMEHIAKGAYSSGDNVAINLGTEIYFVNSKGWLNKRYIANEEIKNVIISDRVAAIIFKDKIEILVL